MKVRAKVDGFFNGHRVRAGTTFELPEGKKLGAWMEVVEDKAKAKAEAKAETKPKADAKPKAEAKEETPLV